MVGLCPCVKLYRADHMLHVLHHEQKALPYSHDAQVDRYVAHTVNMVALFVFLQDFPDQTYQAVDP